MKKVTMTLLTVFTVSAAIAQINKGAWLIGASSNVGFNSYSFKNSPNQSLFNINTKAGYFVIDNFTVGINLGYFNSSQSGFSSSTTSIGVFTRYYLPKNFFLGVGINSVSNSFSSSGTSSSSSSIAIPMELGIAAFITKNIAVEPSINYIKGDDKGGVTYNGLNTGATSAIGLNIGFTVYLNRSNE